MLVADLGPRLSLVYILDTRSVTVTVRGYSGNLKIKIIHFNTLFCYFHNVEDARLVLFLHIVVVLAIYSYQFVLLIERSRITLTFYSKRIR